jgi:hypothetical protein
MPDWLLWFTRYENSKVVALVLFFCVFCGIFIYFPIGSDQYGWNHINTCHLMMSNLM